MTARLPLDCRYAEFEEVVSRIFHASVWQPMQAVEQTAHLLDQDGNGGFDHDAIDGLIRECDADGSGTISAEELFLALKKRLNESAARLVAQRIVAVLDADGGGTLDREELRDAVVKLRDGKGVRAGPAGACGHGHGGTWASSHAHACMRACTRWASPSSRGPSMAG